MGFPTKDRKDNLFNQVQGKDTCMEVINKSSFVGIVISSWAPTASLAGVAQRMKKKYAAKCKENGYKFILFTFSTFGESGEEALDQYA